MKIRRSPMERFFDVFIVLVMCFVIVITLYPFIYVFSMSISDPTAAGRQEVWLFPKGFSLSAYKLVFENPDIWQAYYNTIWYTVVGTLFNVIMTITLAYPLSRKGFFLKNHIMFFAAFTMFFSGGMIPLFILINKLGLYDTRWALILPTALGVWYVIIARSFFQSIPDSLIESAKLDGANDITILRRIVLPLSMPIISVLILFYAVGHWNQYFDAMIYLADKKLQPLQLYLMRILISNTESLMEGVSDSEQKSLAVMQIKYAIIMVAVLPIILVYPFLQKHFVKGMMIGAIKE